MSVADFTYIVRIFGAERRKGDRPPRLMARNASRQGLKSMNMLITAILAMLLMSPARAVEKNNPYAKPLPRAIIALYDADSEERPRYSLMHRFLEMPLNQLGFVVHYYHINAPLPKLGDDVYGVIWFLREASVKQPEALMKWAADAVDHGKKVVVFGYLGVSDQFRSGTDGMKLVNNFLNKIGVNDDDQWVGVTYDVKKRFADETVVDFDRKMGNVLPPYMAMSAVGPGAKSYLELIRKNIKTDDDITSDMVITSPNGGYVAPGYGAYYDEDLKTRYWMINPFKFLHLALHDESSPKPDVTTMDGMRIFYAHIDGDGWDNFTEIKPYSDSHLYSPEVLEKEILEKYSDFPFTLGIIADEISPSCHGSEKMEEIAKRIFALPNVEIGSHTYSHPLYWKYFADGDSLKEEKLLKYYSNTPGEKHGLLLSWLSGFDWFRGFFGLGPTWSKAMIEAVSKKQPIKDTESESSHQGYETENANRVLESYFGVPRSYACEPFDLDKEIRGAVDYTNSLAPAGKKVKVYQWSGDTGPFEAAVKMTRDLGVRNINGGDTRFDPEYPSYAWISPIGIRVGEQQQIFSSSSNENTYTKLWQGRYYGYKYLINTVENTDKPIRVKPFNIYFHIFSGEKQASLNAVKEDLDYARKQEIIPIFASQYAAIADGFYSTRFVALSENKWRVINRGELQTIRFDDADGKTVDFASSEGVLGQNRWNGSLYVALDPDVAAPEVSIKNGADGAGPYLVKSRWAVRRLTRYSNGIEFMAYGFGPGSMEWKMPQGEYEVFVNYGKNTVRNEGKYVNDAGLVRLTINYPGGFNNNSPVMVRIIRRQ